MRSVICNGPGGFGENTLGSVNTAAGLAMNGHGEWPTITTSSGDHVLTGIKNMGTGAGESRSWRDHSNVWHGIERGDVVQWEAPDDSEEADAAALFPPEFPIGEARPARAGEVPDVGGWLMIPTDHD